MAGSVKIGMPWWYPALAETTDMLQLTGLGSSKEEKVLQRQADGRIFAAVGE